MKANPLVGKVLTAVHVSQDRLKLKFDIEGEEPIVAACDADCCSYTWVETVEACALPARVTEVENIDLPEQGESGAQGGEHGPESTESVAFYGLKITTAKGHIVIDYRNDSNGYYGGSLSWPGDSFYGGVYGQNKSASEVWIEVKP